MQDFLPAFADFSRASPYDFTHVALTLPLGGAGGEVLGLLQTEHSGINFNPFVNASHTDAERHYFGKDHLGSVRAVTNQWGSPLYMFDYDVFGQPLQDRPERFRHGFTGKEFDSWTGLYNYGFRDYASFYGRFTTVDPIQDGHNWYAYAVSDPVNWLDPWGLDCPPDTKSGGDQKQHLDPKGRGVANNTDYYIALKLEDPVYIGDKKGRRAQKADEGNWLNFIIAAPHSVIEGYFDGAIDMHGNIIKVSAHYPDRVSFSAEYDETGAFVAVITDNASKATDYLVNKVKQISNFISENSSLFNKHYDLSGSYPNQKNDDAPLHGWWNDMLKEVGDPDLWNYKVISPNQAKLRDAMDRKK